jgi:alanine racemase
VRRGLTAEIDLDAAEHNFNALKSTVNNLPVIAVVKADAYGHGAARLSRTFEKAGAHALAVAFTSEALELREHGVGAPILVLFDRSHVSEYFDHRLTPVIHDLGAAQAFSAEAGRRNLRLGVHLKVDTGMGRMGLSGQAEVERAASLPNLEVAGLMSHFSEADLADVDYARAQLGRFLEIRDSLNRRGLAPLCHMSNSAATLSFRKSHLDAVRPGLVLYGSPPSEDDSENPFRPVMTVKARVLALRRLGKGQPVSYERTFVTTRPTLAAVLAAGYADGYSRLFSNNSQVLLRGRRAPVIGRVCMDLSVVDATDVEGVSEGDEAVLLGSDGDETITAWELARKSSTIPYEVLISMGNMARRVYSGASTDSDD